MPINKKKIISVIKKDATLREEYYDPATGDACVIGGLLLAAGFPKRKLAKWGARSITLWRGGIRDFNRNLVGVKQAADLLKKKFGLDSVACQTLQHTNDSYFQTKERRRVLCGVVEALE